MKARAASSCAESRSWRRTRQPARANTMAQARPMRPAPMTATIFSMASHPEHPAAQIEIQAQRRRCALMDDAAALQHIGAVGERQHEIEIMLDNDHLDFAAPPVSRFEDVLDTPPR